ncbi:MAG: minor histocompatibility antigen H13-like [Trebouxia sp. A1-2]|nr:MAG: minor histocompatibility antigen H13-like [Trebouxia sp. A1-2]
MSSSQDAAKTDKLPCPWSHLCLALVAVAPSLITVPANLNIVLTAAVTVWVGSHRSVKDTPPEESMTRTDALKFPLVGSAVLFGLFITFKVLPKNLVNLVLAGYFALLGVLALTATALPFIEQLCSARVKKLSWTAPKFHLPYFKEKHWLANNVLGLAFSVQGIEHLSLGAVSTGVILLSGLFFYDIFWVFCTPVMVAVAKSFDAPIKLLFPRALEEGSKTMPFSMLGLGDIVIPGIFVALVLRYDTLHNARYFRSAYGGYVLGLGTTIVVMNVFEAAQPALLYIVPAVLAAVLGHAAINKQFLEVFHFSESKDKDETDVQDVNKEDNNAQDGQLPAGTVQSQASDKKIS